MSVHFTMEEMTAIAFYHPERGRLATIQRITMSLPHMEDKAVQALLRGALAKLNACGDGEFAGCDFDAAEAAFE